MKRYLTLLMLAAAGAVKAQTDTPTPDVFIYATLEAGQTTRFDYVMSAGNLFNNALLLLLLFSLWGMFLFAVLVMTRGRAA